MTVSRNEAKQASRERILKAASRRLRTHGLDGAAIAPVMAEAGLTHGAFTAHFRNKDELTHEAFRYAINQSQPEWLAAEQGAGRLKHMGDAYLSTRHRDHPGDGCPIAALASQVASSSVEGFRDRYSDELLRTFLEIAELDNPASDPAAYNRAIVFFALCIGGLSLSRNIADPTASDAVLEICRDAIGKL